MTDTDKSFPAVSIVMPTYNSAAFISETIESIRNQSFKNWELIIIDDGSDDGTTEIIEQLKDERITCYKEKHSGIISKVRKMGVGKASAALIAFMDSDDLWADTKLEEQVLALEQNKDAGFCLAGGYNFIQAGVPRDFFYKQKEGMKYGDLFPSFFQSELAVYLQALMFRKECMNSSAPFKETDNDVDFILRLATNFKGLILYKLLFFRRIHDINYSNLNWKKNYDKGISVIQSYAASTDAEIIRTAFFKLYINYGEDCLKNGERKNAVQHFFKAWRYKPYSIIPVKKTMKSMFSSFKR
jgi:glycosyltransferase involved in cell wall biosynthesis